VSAGVPYIFILSPTLATAKMTCLQVKSPKKKSEKFSGKKGAGGYGSSTLNKNA
jgi:hypothetical protein